MKLMRKEKKMSVLFNEIAGIILLKGIDTFNPEKYNIEYRKSKSRDELNQLINSINLKNTDFESKTTLLSISLKNFFKKLRSRKYTLVYFKDDKIKVDLITTQKDPSVIKKSTNNFVALFVGHCKHEM